MKKKEKEQVRKLSLKEIRKKRDLSQDYVAQYLKISRPTLSLMEEGKKELTFSQLFSLEELYKIEIDELVEGAQDEWNKRMEKNGKDYEKKMRHSLIKMGQKFGSIPHKAKKQEKE